MPEWSDRIQAAIARHGWDVPQLLAAFEVIGYTPDPSTVYKWVRGQHPPRADFLEALVRVTGEDATTILLGEPSGDREKLNAVRRLLGEACSLIDTPPVTAEPAGGDPAEAARRRDERVRAGRAAKREGKRKGPGAQESPPAAGENG